RHAMRAEYDRDAIGNLVERFDENRAFGLQRVDDIAVMHDLVPDIDRRAIFLQREFDDADRAIDAGAETARRGDQNLEFCRFAAPCGRRRIGSVHDARALAQQVPWGKAASSPSRLPFSLVASLCRSLCCAAFIAPIRSGAHEAGSIVSALVPCACLESPIIMMPISFPSRKFLTVLCGTAAMATAAGCAKDNEIAI